MLREAMSYEDDSTTYDDRLNVCVTLAQILDDFVKVAAEQVLVCEELLLTEELADLVLLGLVALADDSHSVVVLLPVEDHVQASLMEFVH